MLFQFPGLEVGSQHSSMGGALDGLHPFGPDGLTFWAGNKYFLALHDLGKFSYRFQALRSDLRTGPSPDRGKGV
ncbi:hypothetical protein CCP3SC15_10001 [Gammaproteobacteria bacterium]